MRVRAETTVEIPHAGPPRWAATGVVERGGEPIGEIAGSDATADNPVAAALALLSPPAAERHARPPRTIAEAEDAAPVSMEAFARVGGDRNPLHRSVLAARMAGLPRPIVHGAWTAARAAAFVVDELCGGDATALRDWRVTFLAPVELGAVLDFEATRVAVSEGRRVVQVRVRAGETDVALGEAVVDQPPTALLFPGQGIQRPGLGADGRGRSRAARAVWERADVHTRERLGFSLLDVVERNPRELRLADGRVRRHPNGVLYRTEFTQPALLVLAAAQLAELRAEGAVGERVIAAGHSVGEFAALHALGALELEPALDLVYRRGELMQAHVPRDADGASPYRLAVVDPSAAGIEIEALEGDVEVVNHNATGRQYAVAGTAGAMAALEARYGRRAVRVLPGIDVPFHSSVLRGAVAEFRPYLEIALRDLDPERLVGRWVPNLLGRPFSLEDSAIDLLAQQLAAPVRWIETQHALAGMGVRRFVEVGARARRRAHRSRPDHAPRDRHPPAPRGARPRRGARSRGGASGGVRPGGGAHRGGHVRSLREGYRPTGPSMPAPRSNTCSRCRRGYGSTNWTRRSRWTSCSKASRHGATRC